LYIAYKISQEQLFPKSGRPETSAAGLVSSISVASETTLVRPKRKIADKKYRDGWIFRIYGFMLTLIVAGLLAIEVGC
ncbi:hypothetical protein BDK51DRAFT_52098, partial [Blyttiomyces helicus]